MTDTGQVPGEGQPESAGMVEQPGVPAHGAYTYLSEAPAEDEDLLLPGAQGAWGNEVPPPAPEPVVEAVHEPGPHETSGRDSGSVDLSGVRLPNPAPASVPPSPILSAPHDPAAAPQPPRRPLHLGPPIPDASASPVRSLADRGPAGAPVRQPGPVASGPEYLDAQSQAAPQSAAPWGAAQVATQAPADETVGPSDPAQATVARLTSQASSPTDTGHVQVVHGHDGAQPVHAHDGVYTAPVTPGAEGAQVGVAGADVASGEAGAVADAAPPAVQAADEAPEPAHVGVQGAEGGAEQAGTGQVPPMPEAPEVPGTVPADQSVPAEAAPGQAVPTGALPSEATGAEGAADAAPVAGTSAEAAPQPPAPADDVQPDETAQPTDATAAARTADAGQDPGAGDGAAAPQATAQPADAAPLADPAQAAVVAQAADAVQSAEGAQAAEASQAADDAQAAEASQAAVAGNAAGAVQPGDPAQPADAEQIAAAGLPEGAAQAAGAAQSAEGAPIAEAPQTAPDLHAAGAVQPADPAQQTGAEQIAAAGLPEGAAQAAGAAQSAEGAPIADAPQTAPDLHAAGAVQPADPAQPTGAEQIAAAGLPEGAAQVADAAQVTGGGRIAEVPQAAAAGQAAAAPQSVDAAQPAGSEQIAGAVQAEGHAPVNGGAQIPEAPQAADAGQAVDASHPAHPAQPTGAEQIAGVGQPEGHAQADSGAQIPEGHAPVNGGAQIPDASQAADAGQAVGAVQPANPAQPAGAEQMADEPQHAGAQQVAVAHAADAAQPQPPAEAQASAGAQGAVESADAVAPQGVGEATDAVVAQNAAPTPDAATAQVTVDGAALAPTQATVDGAAPALAQAAEPAVAAQAAQPTAAQTAVGSRAPQPAAPADASQTPAPLAGDGTAEAAEVTEPVVLQGPQLAESVPQAVDAPAAQAAPQPDAAPGAAVADAPRPQGPAQNPEQPLPSGLPVGADPRPLGEFVPVEGQVPTTPHLAPTPPHPLVVPAPRDGEPAGELTPDVVQHAEDLRTRAADQEESTAAVAEARQSTGPAAPGYADAEREAVLKVMRERRDIRNGFRSDPIPHEVLLRVLEAAHTAPSVGHSQPWDFVVIRSAETRRTMHELAMRQREAYAKSLPKGRAKQFKELKIEAILDTPVNIVVTADPTRGGRHTLGRHTQPQMAPYSSALAVENLWLAARAEGLGVGWVSFFDEREMVRALGLPEHLEVVAYLCVGYVDEFPDEPELMQAGWSKRRPLSWVVHEETYGRRALPGEEPHDLLAETVAQIRPLDAKALGEAWERQKRMTKPAGALGMLEIISAQLCGLSRQCPPPIPEPAAVAIFAGDHGVHAQGVTPWPQEVTAQMVANFLGGGAVCNAFAGQVGAEVCVVDVGVAADLPATPGLLPRKIRGGTSDMTTGPAMTREEARAAIEVGIETARDLVAAGNKALLTGEMGIANTTASAALISVFTGADPAEVTGRGTGINDETLARKTEVVRRALELHQPDPADPIGVLAAIGGFEHAAMVGLLLGGASLRTPVILDGVSAGAAALVARAIAPEVLAACIAGHRSAEPGHVAALNKLGLRPLVDLDLRLGEGTGALLALPLVQSTARAMHEVATFDSAGVTEK